MEVPTTMMSSNISPLSPETPDHDRRTSHRVAMQLYVNEFIADRPYRGLVTNVSPRGLYVHRVLSPHDRRSRVVAVEFELPGTSDSIWARGEVRFDSIDGLCHGTGIELVGIARSHARRLRDYVLTKREETLRMLLDQVRKRRVQ
jgi:hypothetical protein